MVSISTSCMKLGKSKEKDFLLKKPFADAFSKPGLVDPLAYGWAMIS